MQVIFARLGNSNTICLSEDQLGERWFAMPTEQLLKRGTHLRTRALRKAIKQYGRLTNENPEPFVWTTTADEILPSVARFCQRTSGSGH